MADHWNIDCSGRRFDDFLEREKVGSKIELVVREIVNVRIPILIWRNLPKV